MKAYKSVLEKLLVCANTGRVQYAYKVLTWIDTEHPSTSEKLKAVLMWLN